MRQKLMAEFIGTLALVLVGCGTVVAGGAAAGTVGIALAFGLTVLAMAYGIGPISGGHLNPAVSLGVFAAGRMDRRELVGYVGAQVLGGIVGALLLWWLANGQLGGFDVRAMGLGQNGWGPGYQGQYNVGSAALFEFLATGLFVTVILGTTLHKDAPKQMAGLAIGLTLTALHLLGLQITGVSVNPARSLGPALVVGGQALAQLWLFLLVPSIAGLAAGLLSRVLMPEEVLTSPPLVGHRPAAGLS